MAGTDSYVARANIDHYLELLGRHGIAPENRRTINKLLIEQENMLAHNLEQLDFAECKLLMCRDRVKHLRRLRDVFVEGSVERTQAESLLVTFEGTLEQVESFCALLREKVNASPI